MTHTGFIPGQSRRKGRAGRTNPGHHAEHRHGVVHALVADGRDWIALCGVQVKRAYGSSEDIDGEQTGHVRPTGELQVTCKDCRVKM